MKKEDFVVLTWTWTCPKCGEKVRTHQPMLKKDFSFLPKIIAGETVPVIPKKELITYSKCIKCETPTVLNYADAEIEDFKP